MHVDTKAIEKAMTEKKTASLFQLVFVFFVWCVSVLVYISNEQKPQQNQNTAMQPQRKIPTHGPPNTLKQTNTIALKFINPRYSCQPCIDKSNAKAMQHTCNTHKDTSKYSTCIKHVLTYACVQILDF